MKIRRFVLPWIVLVAWGLGCADDTTPNPKPEPEVDMAADLPLDADLGDDTGEVDEPVGISISPESVTLNLNATERLTLSLDLESGASRPAITKSWASDAPEVAEVTEDGVVIGRAIGAAQVTATHEGFEAAVDVRVVGLPVARIELRPSGGSIAVGDTITIIVDLFDAQNASIMDPRDVEFTSSDTGVLTVDENGVVTAVAAGMAEISVTVESQTASASFEVPEVVVEGVSIDQGTTRLIWHDVEQLTATITYTGPPPTADPTITWSSSDAAVVSVDAAGNVIALKSGQAIITAAVSGKSDTVTVIVDTAFTEISVGDAHVCGLILKQVVCWGDNSAGQLGHVGTAPERVVLPGPAKHVVAGGKHSCALLETGAVWCWGDDSQGQLGNGPGGSSAIPVAVASNIIYRDIAVGRSHSCGGSSSGLYCWGAGQGGRLGTGQEVDQQTPTYVRIAARHVALGAAHSCASQSCWGTNDAGQLGINTISASELTPQAVAGGYNFAIFSLGDRHSCGLSVTNELTCWGSNDRSQIGDGTNVTRTTPILVSTTTALGRVAVGSFHTCGLSGQGQAFCWGANDGGLGQVTNQDISIPSPITSTIRFFMLGAGKAFTCGLSTSGIPYCWGAGALGQLGGVADSVTPVRIAPF